MKQSSRLPDGLIELIRTTQPIKCELLIQQLSSYRELIVRVNQKINLVSRRQTESVVDDLLYDSVSLLQFVVPPAETRILDLGSGAGFPGLVIAAAYPEALLISVEANRRKIEFQRQAAREMGLKNIQLVSGRIEAIAPLHTEIAFAKAFSSIEVVLNLIAPHLMNGGKLIMPRSSSEESAKVDWQSHGYELQSVNQYQSGTIGRTSQLIHIKKL